MILLIDNYDSFVHNLARYFRRLGFDTEIVRNDAVAIEEIARRAPQAIVLSPGPCTPNEAGCSLDVVRELHREFPILGVCLGHQTIAASFGATVVRATEPMHGRTSLVHHSGSPLFRSVPSPFQACRYHSLVAERQTIPEALEVTATIDDGTVMAIEHRELPVCGVQFHPEAVLSSHGFQILANFLHWAGLPTNADIEYLSRSEIENSETPERLLPPSPVTF